MLFRLKKKFGAAQNNGDNFKKETIWLKLCLKIVAVVLTPNKLQSGHPV